MRKLDRIDIAILTALQSSGRLTNAALANAVHLSPSPCLDRVRRLEREGYILGYGAHLSPARMGLRLLAYVEVCLKNTEAESLDAFAQAVAEVPEIQECHMIAGNFDYLLKVRAADMDAFRVLVGRTISSLPHVSATHSYMVMEEVKSSWAIACDGGSPVDTTATLVDGLD